MSYVQESSINENDKITLTAIFNGVISVIKHISVSKVATYLQEIPLICKLQYLSLEHRRERTRNPLHIHPVVPHRGEIYNTFITEGVGSELCGNHLSLVISNNKGNLYGEKVIIVPIEGDGNCVNLNYHVRLTNNDMEVGKIDKDPSRIIITDIMTIDKSRLGRKIGMVNQSFLLKVNVMIKKQLSLNTYDPSIDK